MIARNQALALLALMCALAWVYMLLGMPGSGWVHGW
jgi:hypothetical protein